MIREEDEQCSKSLTQTQIKVLIKNCDYFSHIVFPYESQKILQQSGTKSLSSEQPKKQSQLQPHQLTGNKQKQTSQIKQFLHLFTMKKDNFNRICVQLFYFMFSCMKQNIVVDFHEQCFVYCGGRAKFMVVLKQVMRGRKQKIMDKGYFRLYVKTIRELVVALEKNILKIQHMVQLLKDDKDNMQSQNIDKVFNEINSNIVNAKNTIQYLQYFIVSAERVDSDIKIEVNCFKQLEKQQFISQNSILRKMTHKSINIYLQKIASKQSQDKLIAAIKSEAKFTKLYNAIKSTAMGTQQKLAQVYEAITSNFEKYIQQCWKQNPLYTKIVQPISSDSKQPTEQKPMLFKVKYKTRNQAQNPPKQKQKQRILQYSIQYHSNTQFPSLIIRLHTQITLQPSTTDEQLQKLNMYAFGSDYFSIEISPCQKNKKTIIFKTISKLIRGSSILLHFLRYIDMLMVAEQVIQHEDIGKLSWDGKGKEGMIQQEEIVKEIKHYAGLASDLSMSYYQFVAKAG